MRFELPIEKPGLLTNPEIRAFFKKDPELLEEIEAANARRMGALSSYRNTTPETAAQEMQDILRVEDQKYNPWRIELFRMIQALDPAVLSEYNDYPRDKDPKELTPEEREFENRHRGVFGHFLTIIRYLKKSREVANDSVDWKGLQFPFQFYSRQFKDPSASAAGVPNKFADDLNLLTKIYNSSSAQKDAREIEMTQRKAPLFLHSLETLWGNMKELGLPYDYFAINGIPAAYSQEQVLNMLRLVEKVLEKGLPEGNHGWW